MSSMTHVVDIEATPTAQALTIDHFQSQLLRLKEEGLTNKQLLDWLLEEEGIQCTLRISRTPPTAMGGSPYRRDSDTNY